MALYDSRLSAISGETAVQYLQTLDKDLLVPRFLQEDPLRNNDHVTRLRTARESMRSNGRDRLSLKAVASRMEALSFATDGASAELLDALRHPARFATGAYLPIGLLVSAYESLEFDQSTSVGLYHYGSQTIVMCIDIIGYESESQRARFLQHIAEAAMRRLLPECYRPENATDSNSPRAYREGALRREQTLPFEITGPPGDATSFHANDSISFEAVVSPEEKDLIMTVRWQMPGEVPQIERLRASHHSVNRLKFRQVCIGSGVGSIEVALEGEPVFSQRFHILASPKESPVTPTNSR
jgi:hypothetical protein